MAEEYEAQGDGWDMPTGVMPVGKERIIRAAASGDVPEVRRLISLGTIPLPYLLYHACATDKTKALETLLEAGGTVEANARSIYGWTSLGQAASQGHDKCVAMLLAAGVDPNRRVLNDHFDHTPLQLAMRPPRPGHLRACYLLLRAGATIPPDTENPYLLKVAAAGGLRAYEKAHRARLAATLARVVFPRLPVDALSHVAAFAFHTGAY